MVYTGGELNWLNGKYGISAPNRSVPIIMLIRKHKPKSNEELVNLIASHYMDKCDCGIKSQGTIEMFGKNLYEVQMRERGNYKYSLNECIQREYDLFVIQSLKGNKIEDKIKLLLNSKVKLISKDLSVEDANNYLDEELRIDLVIKSGIQDICGIQVKPSSYKHVRENVKFMNSYRNKISKLPVIYVYYDYDKELIENLNESLSFIKDQLI